jgi:hypothetical protein
MTGARATVQWNRRDALLGRRAPQRLCHLAHWTGWRSGPRRPTPCTCSSALAAAPSHRSAPPPPPPPPHKSPCNNNTPSVRSMAGARAAAWMPVQLIFCSSPSPSPSPTLVDLQTPAVLFIHAIHVPSYLGVSAGSESRDERRVWQHGRSGRMAVADESRHRHLPAAPQARRGVSCAPPSPLPCVFLLPSSVLPSCPSLPVSSFP